MKFQYIDTKHEFYAKAKKIRIACFFQGMNDAEKLINDNFEEDGYHLVCIGEKGIVLGTGRLNIENSTGIISQMAVLAKYQKLGIGMSILTQLLEKCRATELETIELNARETAISFYEKMHFEVVGDKYPSHKTGILHQKMVKKLK
ncbi:GNAT family N-acetyltransferase [Marivirga sericea]|uniref:GNAT family N-acetyltransferase n=1 Tax=Marivirga sericea TaxID=1028 RepID=UPI000A1CCDD9|nr:GNAT family N-acetyltransferase [Marivirga sericea]